MTTSKSTNIDSLSTSFSLTQITSDPIDILTNSSLCIDIVFSNQLNLVIESRVDPSLHPKYHYQNVFCKV